MCTYIYIGLYAKIETQINSCMLYIYQQFLVKSIKVTVGGRKFSFFFILYVSFPYNNIYVVINGALLKNTLVV